MHFLPVKLQMESLNNSADIDAALASLPPENWQDSLLDPFALPDMAKFITVLQQALIEKQKILIYGDYDLDGMSAAATLYLTLLRLKYALQELQNAGELETSPKLAEFLQTLQSSGNFSKIVAQTRTDAGPIIQADYNLAVYIPDRLQEGYSISEKAVNYIISEKYDLVITVDCGVKSAAEIEKLNNAGITVLVSDHHECPEILPPAAAVVNPKREDSAYANRDLSGSAVVLKIVQALEQSWRIKGFLTSEIVEIAALGIISDVMQLSWENCLIVRIAFNKIKAGKAQVGLAILLQKLNLAPQRLTYADVAFYICPKFNACGRISDPYIGLSCLLAAKSDFADKCVEELLAVNEQRKLMTEKAAELAENYLYAHAEVLQNVILCVPLSAVHAGIIGIVAAKLQEKYLKPCLCFTNSDDSEKILKASGRSYGNFDLYKVVNTLFHRRPELFISFGGHKQAVGLSIKSEDFPKFTAALQELAANENLLPENITYKYSAADNLPDLPELLQRNATEPYGQGRRAPIYLYCGAYRNIAAWGKEGKHVRLETATGKKLLAFNRPELQKMCTLTPNNIVLLLEAGINEYRGNLSAQYVIKNYCLTPLTHKLRTVMNLQGLKATTIYQVLVDYYLVLSKFSASALVYFSDAAFVATYFPLLRAYLHNEMQTEYTLSVTASIQCRQILAELGIISVFPLTNEVQLLKINRLQQKINLQAAPSYCRWVQNENK